MVKGFELVLILLQLFLSGTEGKQPHQLVRKVRQNQGCTFSHHDLITEQIPDKSSKIRKQRISEIKCKEIYNVSHPLVTGLTTHDDDDDDATTTSEVVQGIIVGIRDSPEEFRHMAMLGWFKSFNYVRYEYLCGGTLISEDFVLTPAHCTSIDGIAPEVVRIGGENLQDELLNSDIGIMRFHVHPQYREGQLYNDIALLKLSFTTFHKPACLWQTQEIIYSKATAIGYGRTIIGDKKSSELKEVILNIFPNQECSRYLKPASKLENRGVIDDSQMCAGDPNKIKTNDTCLGDSGGPLMVKVVITTRNYEVIPYILGITTCGQGCAGGPPSIYTRVSSYLDWIESIVWP